MAFRTVIGDGVAKMMIFQCGEKKIIFVYQKKNKILVKIRMLVDLIFQLE